MTPMLPKFTRYLLTLSAAALVMFAAAAAGQAQQPAEHPAGKPAPPHGPGAHAKTHLKHHAPGEHGKGEHGKGEHGKGEHGKGEHGEHGAHDHHHGPPAWPNLMHGWLGASEDGANAPPAGAEPGSGAWWAWYLTPTMFRGEDEPVPFIANIVNFLVLAFLIYRFGRKPIGEGLRKRKATIMAAIDEATSIKNKATERLEHYEGELDHLDDKLGALKEQYAHEAEVDEKRIVQDASEARDRLMADAKFRVAQESKSARDELTNKALENALSAAEELVKTRVTKADHDRLADEYLEQISTAIKEQTAPQGASQ